MLSLNRMFRRSTLLTFVIMMLSALGFGILSYNIFLLFSANIIFISENGLMGLKEGGFYQLILLILNGSVSLFFYIVFKACEKTLVEKLLK